VAQHFRELGAVVIDADQLAREVVAVGSIGLSAVHQRFGDTVMTADGSLDRGALGAIVFADPRARADLEAITHPLIGARTRALAESAGRGRIVVHDVPLLVEKDLGGSYHLTVVVAADEDIRVSRLTGIRGLTLADARARIQAQATDPERRAAADAWLGNNGTVDEVLAQADALWRQRMVGFNDNLTTGSRSRRSDLPTLVPYDDSWASAAVRLVQRVNMALGERAVAVEHIGSTSVPGLPAKDVIDLQIAVRHLSDADSPEFVNALQDKGFPRSGGNDQDSVHPWAPAPSSWGKRFHGSADPGRVAHVHVREHGSSGWEAALLFRDWLAADLTERDDYADLKRALARTETTTTAYTVAKEPWIAAALERAQVWARHTGWVAR